MRGLGCREMSQANGWRVSVVHSFYSGAQPSGENRAVLQQVDVMRRAGWDVGLHRRDTDEESRQPLYRARSAFRVSTGRGGSPDFEPATAGMVDVTVVHNLFPNFGWRWVSGRSGLLIAVMHNFRTVCASGTLFRDGHICTDCLTKLSTIPSVLHGCYRDSRLATLPLAIGNSFADHPLLSRADAVVVLSERMADIFEAAGVERSKLYIIPNFVPEDGRLGEGKGPWLYVGRLTEDKGVDRLLAEWPSEAPLVMAGSGPMDSQVLEFARNNPNVRFLGAVSPEVVQELMGKARGLIFPSRWYEGLPMVYVEALAKGTPTVAWSPSVVAELVQAEGTGVVVDGGLSETLRAADEAFLGLRDHCRAVFEKRYSASAWLEAFTRLIENLASGS